MDDKIKYIIVESSTLLILGIDVNRKMNYGYCPIGGVAINIQESVSDSEFPIGLYCQAMILK